MCCLQVLLRSGLCIGPQNPPRSSTHFRAAPLPNGRSLQGSRWNRPCSCHPDRIGEDCVSFPVHSRHDGYLENTITLPRHKIPHRPGDHRRQIASSIIPLRTLHVLAYHAPHYLLPHVRSTVVAVDASRRHVPMSGTSHPRRRRRNLLLIFLKGRNWRK